jgi:hypothetical protein
MIELGENMISPGCYACGEVPGPDAWADEHVIPNALGGRWKSPRLLCRACNSAFGADIDAALCRELGAPMNMLGLSRERGSVPNQLVTLGAGDEYLRDAEGNLRRTRPLVRQEQSGDEVQISVTASSTKQLRQTLRSLARKYAGKIDVDEWMQKISMTRRFEESATIFRLRGAGSEACFRGITKVAANAYMATGGSRSQILECVDHINGQRVRCARWYYCADVLDARQPEELTHIVGLHGTPGGRLWAYVELFRAFRFAVRLSSNYSGEPVSVNYVYDLIGGKVLDDRHVHCDFGELDLEDGGIDVDAVAANLNVLMLLATRRSRERELGAAVDEAFERARAVNPNCTLDDLQVHLWAALEPRLIAMMRRPTPLATDADQQGEDDCDDD